MKRTNRALIVAILIVALPWIVLAGAWRMAGVSALEDDLLYYFPQRAFFGDAVRSGEIPFWNPLVGMGYPSAADPQVGTWYPATWLFIILPATSAYPLAICLHFALAGWGAYRLLRWMRLRWPAALFGAVAFEFCGFLIAHRAHLTMHHAAAWLPLVVWLWGKQAATGRRRHWATAVACTGLSLLVQHIQVSIITVLIAGIWSIRTSRLHGRRWALPVGGGLTLAGGIAAVQIVPTLYFFAACTRSQPLYERFTENSYEPASLALWFFPMLFGTRTPNFYSQPWWGPSHLCEQTVYASWLVLVFATSAVALWQRNGVVRFWAVTGMVCLALAFGRYNPLTWILFKIPVLAPLRVPARWLLGVNLAWVILASVAMDAVMRRGPMRAIVARWLGRMVRYGIPAALAAVAVGMLVVARFDAPVPRLALQSPSVFVPIMLAGTTLVAVTWFRRRPGRATCALLIVLLVVDLASFAAFNDVDRSTYPGSHVLTPEGSSNAVTWLRNQGGRAWVPRERADYDRPLDIAWPMSNLIYGVATAQAYTPLVRAETRQLLGFRPWGATERALSLLRNPGLLRALSIRWLVGRSEAERQLLASAGGPDDASGWEAIDAATNLIEVIDRQGVRWPVHVDAAGLYGLEFTAAPPARQLPRRRWFVILEGPDGQNLAPELVFEPTDLLVDGRRLRCFFRVETAVKREKPSFIRVYAYGDAAVRVGNARFARVADLDSPSADFVERRRDDNNVVAYELTDCPPRFYLVRETTHAESNADAIRKVEIAGHHGRLPAHAVVEGFTGRAGGFGSGTIDAVDENLNERMIRVTTQDGGFLVIAESFDRGWTADINGEPTAIFRTNGILQGVPVPAGTSHVTLRYRPPGLRIGVLITLASIAVVACFSHSKREASSK